MLPQEGCGVGRNAETGQEELIVGLMDRGLAKRHDESDGNKMRGVNGRNVTILTNAAPVSFTVETTVLPSFARRRAG
jgi:hypothetical protein